MTTPKQRAANRANALKSTGPQSEAGKFHSKINSIKHGLSQPVDEHLYANEIKEITEDDEHLFEFFISAIKNFNFDFDNENLLIQDHYQVM